MRFAAAEIGLQLHHGVAALAGKTPHRANQHALQALREICAAKELNRIFVFVRAFAEMYLPQISRELGLPIAAARHILVWRHYLAPRLEVACYLALNSGAGTLAFFTTHLLVEDEPP